MGLLGSAIVRSLNANGYYNIATEKHRDVDLRDRFGTEVLFRKHKPEYVFLCAAHAGGIKEAIDNPAEMLSDNILIQTNVIDGCKKFGVKKLINFGSSCLYPIDGEQPYKEEQLGTGRTDENWSYAVAKLAGIELCRAYHRQYGCNFMTVIPCNLYGINDRFDEYGHVIPSLIRKFHTQDSVSVWGDPETRREFLYVDDLAKACVQLMEYYDYDDLCDGVINIGSGYETTIRQLVDIINNVVNKDAVYRFNHKVLGVKSKLMDSSRAFYNLMWSPETKLEDGIRRVYASYCACN